MLKLKRSLQFISRLNRETEISFSPPGMFPDASNNEGMYCRFAVSVVRLLSESGERSLIHELLTWPLPASPKSQVYRGVGIAVPGLLIT